MNGKSLWSALFALLVLVGTARGETLPGFRVSPFWNEQTLVEKTADGARLLYNAPGRMDSGKPTLLIVYATPNGNTTEQTMGCARGPGMDWHYDIQHIAAQTRLWRIMDSRENIALVVVQAEGKSWPAWRGKTEAASARIRALVEGARAKFEGETRVVLSAHSGGGSFLFGFLEAHEAIPAYVERIAFLDANYSYSDEAHRHKLIAWLNGDSERRLVVLAYDDRNITLDGKKVVGPAGGTYRATQRMIAGFRRDITLSRRSTGDLDAWTGMHGRTRFLVDRNPHNRILHTVLVETNGFLYAMAAGAPEEAGIRYRGPRSYDRFIQPCEPEAPVGEQAMEWPARPPESPGGAALMRRALHQSLTEREGLWAAEALRGNVPDFLRTFRVIETASVDRLGRRHTARIAVAPDVLALGNDADFARVPLTPGTAGRIAEAFGCVLPTRRLSDAIHRAAEVKLEPRPLTEDRESAATFLQHNAIIEEQPGGRPPGRLVAGHKKDVVLTNRLPEKPRRVALYGWHFPDGTPIQPLYAGHAETYVDYSHGIRLIARTLTVDGRTMDYAEVLRDPDLCGLLSDEGPIRRAPADGGASPGLSYNRRGAGRARAGHGTDTEETR